MDQRKTLRSKFLNYYLCLQIYLVWIPMVIAFCFLKEL